MAYDVITDLDLTQGFYTLFVYVNDLTGGLFIRLLLSAIFILCCVITYNSEKNNFGNANFIMITTVSLLVTFIITIILRLISGLIDNWTFGVVLTLFIISLLAFLLQKDNIN